MSRSFPSNKPEYLGDAVYATFDGWIVELRLNAHTNPVVVYLEPAVMEKLIAYWEARQKERST